MAAHLHLETSQKDLEKELYFTNSIQIPLIIPQGVVKVMIKKLAANLEGDRERPSFLTRSGLVSWSEPPFWGNF